MTGPQTRRVVTTGQRLEADMTPQARRYPLAHRSGVLLFGLILSAQTIWRRLTPAARQALLDSYRVASAGASAGAEIPLPALVDVHPGTAASLRRRGLVEGGRLTAAALDVVTYAGLDPPPRPLTPQPSDPPTTPGGPP